mmetsp:Transcript_9431/g.14458  ORF Transcript_9431/g.14458 Transcript_9431/m.14458 type:complete len:92 (+) Transcript_9431:1369-1644(+)
MLERKAQPEEETKKETPKAKPKKPEVDEPNLHPRICLGICRDNFEVNTDLIRQKDVWCLNLASGDKYNNKKWKNYYSVDSKDQKVPRFGYF